MDYRECLPSLQLSPYVDCYWYYQLPAASAGELPLQRCLPLGTVEIIMQLDCNPCSILNSRGVYVDSAELYFTGLYTDTAFWKAAPGTMMFGIRLKPESLMELFHLPASVLLNTVVDARDLMGKVAEDMRAEMTGVFDVARLIRIAEKFLLEKLRNLNIRHNYVVGACRLIRSTKGGISVEAVSERLNVGQRQLERCFKTQFGTSPKTYQRIIRFRHAYAKLRRLDRQDLRWTELSHSSGYADQAHFIRDFKSFTGEVPTVLSANSADFFQTLEASALINPG